MTATAEGFRDSVAELRAGYASGRTRSLSYRRAQLEALDTMLVRHVAEFQAALYADLGKHEVESRLTEIALVTAEIETMLKHLDRWMAPRSVTVPLVLQPARARIHPEPLGVVLVIAPWNYPLQLSLSPVVGAIAAGNAVVLKPSELAPHTSQLLATLIPRYLDDSCLQVVQGGPEVSTELLRERFDHIFFTGSPQIGRLVMHAAAEHLTPVTLELGGKSPTFVDESTDLAIAARRIAWARYLNAGQTCIAPDYLLATPQIAEAMEIHLKDAITSAFGFDPQQSASYGRIVNDAHFERVSRLITGDVVIGGGTEPATRYIAPTVLRADASHPAMQEEIFGPVLPIVTVADYDEAIAFINARPRPLALYVFSERSEVRNAFLDQTVSGSISFNAPMVQMIVHGLPFGGVGESGMGSYHARFSFETFSHRRGFISKPLLPDTLQIAYPPYKEKFTHFLVEHFLAPIKDRKFWP